MNITVCEKVCENCPFRRENSHHLNAEQVRAIVDNYTITPCHMDMVKYTGSENKGVEIYAKVAPEFKVCCGYALARVHYEDRPLLSSVWYSIDYLLRRYPHPTDKSIALIELEDIL